MNGGNHLRPNLSLSNQINSRISISTAWAIANQTCISYGVYQNISNLLALTVGRSRKAVTILDNRLQVISLKVRI